MHIKVDILKTETVKRSGKNATTGRDYAFQTQEAWIFTCDPDTKQERKHPEKIELMLDFDAQPYPVGMYTLDSSSLYVSRKGRLEVSPKLTRVQPPVRTGATA